MEPALHDGDVVLVRKCEPGILIDPLVRTVVGTDTVLEKERARLRRWEFLNGTSDGVPFARLYENPPTALSGQVVVFKNPEIFPTELSVKRLVGYGGQWMKFSSQRYQSLPPYTLYVEGDNKANSRDGRHYGLVSKNLMVGIAEYVVWPPSRWQRIRRIVQKDENGKPRAFWP